MFGFPAGALADIIDRRRLLLVTQLLTAPLMTGFAALVWFHHATPLNYLPITFVSGTAVALISRPWRRAILPQLVGRNELAAAVGLNSFGVSISRVVGPAMIGVVIAWFGMAAPFWLNAVSNMLMIIAVLVWRPVRREVSALPAEHVGRAMLAGLRHARFNLELRAALVRGGGFFPFAAAYWALLPALSRNQIGGGMQGYGILLAAIGAGAVAGTFILPWLRGRMDANSLVVSGTVGTAAATRWRCMPPRATCRLRWRQASSPGFAGSRFSPRSTSRLRHPCPAGCVAEASGCLRKCCLAASRWAALHGARLPPRSGRRRHCWSRRPVLACLRFHC